MEYSMKRVYGLLFTIGLVLVSIQSLQAQIVVRDIGSLLEEGKIRFIEVRGNGTVGGLSLDAAIENLTDQILYVSIYIEKPIYFSNRSKGQNMIALEVYYDKGIYLHGDSRYYIALQPLQYTKVQFVAFGEHLFLTVAKESDTYSIGELPWKLERVLSAISLYMRKYHETRNTKAAQIAIWKAAGYDSYIKQVFSFTDEDEKIANMLVNYTIP
jgi:hypothetical protein